MSVCALLCVSLCVLLCRMTEKDSSAPPFGCTQEERTDEVRSCEQPNPCAEDVVEEEGEGEEPRELARAGKGGIVYLSRIPPFMKPLKVRHLLSQYGEVGRVFLQPEGVHTTTHVFAVRVCNILSCMNHLGWQDLDCDLSVHTYSGTFM